MQINPISCNWLIGVSRIKTNLLTYNKFWKKSISLYPFTFYLPHLWDRLISLNFHSLLNRFEFPGLISEPLFFKISHYLGLNLKFSGDNLGLNRNLIDIKAKRQNFPSKICIEKETERVNEQ